MLTKILLLSAIGQLLALIFKFLVVVVFKSLQVEGDRNDSQMTSVIKNVGSRGKFTQYRLSDGTPQGLVIGKWFAAWITRSNEWGNPKYVAVRLYAFTHAALDKLLIDRERKSELNQLDDKIVPKLRIIRFGTSQWAHETTHSTTIIEFPWFVYTPTTEQLSCLIEIQTHIAKSRNTGSAFLLHGPPGTGKTTMSYLLAKEYRSPIMVSDLTSPRTNIYSILAKRDTFGEHKTIILIDEFDAIYEQLQRGSLVNSTEAGDRVIYNEGTLHTFIDYVITTLDCIILLTTNKGPGDFKKSFTRAGRVYPIEMKQVVSVGVENVDESED